MSDVATIRRLRMRSMRRGIKEMDLILSGWADRRLTELTEDEISLYEQLLNENDQDLYRWVSGQETVPDRYAGLVADISAVTAARADELRTKRV